MNILTFVRKGHAFRRCHPFSSLSEHKTLRRFLWKKLHSKKHERAPTAACSLVCPLLLPIRVGVVDNESEQPQDLRQCYMQESARDCDSEQISVSQARKKTKDVAPSILLAESLSPDSTGNRPTTSQEAFQYCAVN